MAGRIRSIKPELLEDERAASLSDSAWRVWVGSWVLADDYGNFRAGAKYLAASIWQDTTRTAGVDALLAELVKGGFLFVYRVNDQRYARINGWEKHQRVDNAGKRRVPDKSEGEIVSYQELAANLAESSASMNVPANLAARPPTTDHRPPTAEKDPVPAQAPSGAPAGFALEGETPPAKQPKPRTPKPEKPRDPTLRELAGYDLADALATLSAGGGVTCDPVGEMAPRVVQAIKASTPIATLDELSAVSRWLASGAAWQFRETRATLADLCKRGQLTGWRQAAKGGSAKPVNGTNGHAPARSVLGPARPDARPIAPNAIEVEQ